MNCIRVFACLSFTAVATAQTLTIDAATPLITSAHSGTTRVRQSVPAGPLATMGQLNPTAGSAVAITSWWVEVTPVAMSFALWQMAAVPPGSATPARAAAGTHDFLLHLSHPTPISMLISANQWFEVLPGAPQPLVQVDVLDDGVAEFVFTTIPHGAALPIAVVTVGPTPVPIRVRAQNAVTAVGAGAASHLRILATPNNQLDIVRVVTGCSPANHLACLPSFVATGVDFWVGSAGFYPSLLVLGLSSQPIMLPALGSTPCILGPSPDTVLFVPPTVGRYTLPLPAAVRPVDVFAQVVQLYGPTLAVTDAFRVNAY